MDRVCYKHDFIDDRFCDTYIDLCSFVIKLGLAFLVNRLPQTIRKKYNALFVIKEW